MIEHIQLVYLDSSESARFVNVAQTSSAQYVVYGSTSSLLPSSFDQILKNHVMVLGDRIDDMQPFGGGSAGESAA